MIDVKTSSDFSLLQFNILADGLGVNGKFIKCTEDTLIWSNRKYRLVNLIFHQYNPDIICLQEVDHYYDDFKQLFEENNYQSIFIEKKIHQIYIIVMSQMVV